MDIKMNLILMNWIIMVFQTLILQHLNNLANCEDNLALLSATLRTYQRAVCDTDQVILMCPRGTSISIEIAQYTKQDGNDGTTIEELCPLESDKASKPINSIILNNNISLTNTNSNFNNYNISNNSNENSSDNCMWPNAFQYSLLQTVVEACQKKKHCKFHATPNRYGLGASGVGDNTGSSSYHQSASSSLIDPCPRVRRFVEIVYKCRPYEFRSKVACFNDIVQLECNPYSRIAVYSASFGRTEYESIQCPQPQGVREETCLAKYVTETVMQICHGRRKCHLAADPNTFGSPCQKNSRVYLKVVYTCVPKQVLKERYEAVPETDEPDNFDGDINDLYDDDPYYKESEAIPKLFSNSTTTSRLKMNSSGTLSLNSTYFNFTSTLEPIIVNSDNPVMTHSKGINPEESRENLYLVLLLSASTCILICIIVITVRLVMQNKKRNCSASSQDLDESTDSQQKGEDSKQTPIKNAFNDTISELDNGIDMTVVQLPSVSKNENYSSYGPSSSLFGSLGPTNASHSSATLLLQPSSTSNSLIARQSPDILGVTNTTFIGNSNIGNINNNNNQNLATSQQTSKISNNSINTIIPVTSIATFPNSCSLVAAMPPVIFHPASGSSGTILIDNDGTLRRQKSSLIQIRSPPLINNGIQNSTSLSSNQQILTQIQPSIVVISPQQPQIQQQHHQNSTGIDTFNYDGTAPRTLSTGVAHQSQFYYG